MTQRKAETEPPPYGRTQDPTQDNKRQMSNTPHTLAEEFPDQIEAIHQLKVSTPDFARLLKEYDEVNDQIHLAETNVKPVEYAFETELRKRRLAIKDAIAAALSR